MAGANGWRDKSQRARLQRMLGDAGIVFPRLQHGTPERPAQGWYVRMSEGPKRGKIVYLGDYSLLAAGKITELLSSNGNGTHAKPRAARRR